MAAFTSKNPGETIRSSEWNAAFNQVRDWANTYAVLTDTAQTITANHIFSGTPVFSNGITLSAGFTVSAGTAALGTATATTLTTTGAVSVATTFAALGNGTFGGTSGGPSVNLKPGSADCAYIQFFARTASPTVRSGYVGYGTAATTTFSFVNELAGSIAFTTNGVQAMTCSSTNVQLVALGVTGASALAGTLSVGGAMTTSVINGQTISSAANFTGTLATASLATLDSLSVTNATAMGGTLGVTGLATLTTATVTGALQLNGTGVANALVFAGAAPRIKLSSAGSLAWYSNAGAALVTLFDTGDFKMANLASGSATDGYLGIPTNAGVISGTPTNGAGALAFDRTNNVLYVWNGSAWKKTPALT